MQEGIERARAEAQRALALDETLAEAHTSLAWVTFIYDWDWPRRRPAVPPGARAQPALLRGPPVVLVVPDRRWAAPSWRWPRGGRRIALDPASVSIRRSMGWLHYYARQPEQALEQLRRALAMNPTAEENHRLLGLAYVQVGQWDEAAAAFREAIAVSREPGARRAPGSAWWRPAAAGPTRRARSWPSSSARRAGALRLAGGVRHAARRPGRGRPGVRVARPRATSERRGWLAYLNVEPMLDGLRGDPRFRRLQERMRLA